MAWTKHGHQIPNSPVETERPNSVARCGGVKKCIECRQDARDWLDNN